jgi:short-subunit dehydrogenase
MDKLCVIVGFGRGNGMALAKAFAADGHKLALISRSRAKQERNLAELAAAGVDATFFEADAGEPAALSSAFAQIREQLCDPSVLIYNAFAMRMAAPSKTTPEDLLADLRTNVGGALAATPLVLPAMRVAKRGTILFTGGGFALDPVPQFASVGVGKAALRNLALSLAKELNADGIHAATVTICGMVKAGTHFDPEQIAAKFLELHHQPPGSFDAEFVYQ